MTPRDMYGEPLYVGDIVQPYSYPEYTKELLGLLSVHESGVSYWTARYLTGVRIGKEHKSNSCRLVKIGGRFSMDFSSGV